MISPESFTVTNSGEFGGTVRYDHVADHKNHVAYRFTVLSRHRDNVRTDELVFQFGGLGSRDNPVAGQSFTVVGRVGDSGPVRISLLDRVAPTGWVHLLSTTSGYSEATSFVFLLTPYAVVEHCPGDPFLFQGTTFTGRRDEEQGRFYLDRAGATSGDVRHAALYEDGTAIPLATNNTELIWELSGLRYVSMIVPDETVLDRHFLAECLPTRTALGRSRVRFTRVR